MRQVEMTVHPGIPRAPGAPIRTEKEDVMHQHLKTCLTDDNGATAIEYGLIAGLIAFVIITAVTLLGGDLTGIFQGLADAI